MFPVPPSPQLTLAIEIANPTSASAAVALGLVTAGDPSATQLLASEPIREVDRDRDDLVPAIERLLASTGRSRADIRQIAVSIGPGGFTSTRVACATGAMIAEGLGVPALPVPTALVAVIHWQSQHARTPATHEPVAVLMATKADQAWCAVVSGSNRAESARSGSMMNATDILTRRPSVVLADRHLPVSIREALAGAGVPIHPLTFTAESCLVAAALCSPGDPSMLVPIYPREPEAVTLWRARHGPKP